MKKKYDKAENIQIKSFWAAKEMISRAERQGTVILRTSKGKVLPKNLAAKRVNINDT